MLYSGLPVEIEKTERDGVTGRTGEHWHSAKEKLLVLIFTGNRDHSSVRSADLFPLGIMTKNIGTDTKKVREIA
jgi:hypothetical protein